VVEQNAIATRDDAASAIERVVIGGDLAKLDAGQRVAYYRQVCESLGLNPYTQPFAYITLNGKLTLYATRGAADQLRKVNQVSIDKPDIRFEDDWIIVTVVGRDQTGRSDSDVGVVSRTDMRGDFGNALMKAVTKAKRRLTLSLVGLGWLDETEIETIPDARPVNVDAGTGELLPANGRSAWTAAEQKRFTADVVDKQGLGPTDLKRLLPELSDGKRLSDLGSVDDVVALVKERLAQELSDGGDGEAA